MPVVTGRSLAWCWPPYADLFPLRFSIRSKANADHYWYYDGAIGCITVSDTQRTSFKISATNVHAGTIMTGIDAITLTVQHHGFVVPRSPNRPSGAIVLGVTVRQSEA